MHGRPLRGARGQRLALERDGAVVAADEVGVLLAEELGAVLDEEDAEVVVQVVKRLPDVLVDLHAHGQLAAALAEDLLDGEALPGCAHGLDGQGVVHRGKELEGDHGGALRPARRAIAVARDGVDPAELVVLGRVLEGDGVRPLDGKGLRLHRCPRHFGRVYTRRSLVIVDTGIKKLKLGRGRGSSICA